MKHVILKSNSILTPINRNTCPNCNSCNIDVGEYEGYCWVCNEKFPLYVTDFKEIEIDVNSYTFIIESYGYTIYVEASGENEIEAINAFACDHVSYNGLEKMCDNIFKAYYEYVYDKDMDINKFCNLCNIRFTKTELLPVDMQKHYYTSSSFKI